MNSLAPLLRDQRKVDLDHLKLLSVFHFVAGGLSVAGLGFIALHGLMMNAFLDNPEMWKNSQSGPPPKEFFAIFKWFYLAMGLFFLTGGALNVISGVCLRRRKARTFSCVVAGVNMLWVPLGTTLGVFTFLVLLRESVSELYAAATPTSPSSQPP